MDKKSLIIIGACLILTTAVVYMALSSGINLTALKTKCMFLLVTPGKYPAMYEIPIPLGNDYAASAEVTSFTNGSYTFALPWSASEMISDEEVSLYYCTNGPGISVRHKQHPLVTMDDDWKKDEPKQFEEISRFLQAKGIESRLDLFRVILASTPAELSISMDRNDALLKIFLLTLRIPIATVGSPEFSFTYEGGTGFQLGNPVEEPVTLILFDTPEIARSFEVFPRNDVKVLQEDINCIIKSLKKCEPPLSPSE